MKTFPGRCFTGALAICAAFVVSASNAASAADDKSTLSAALEIIGVSFDEKPAGYDFRERARLVLPPDTQNLPAPESKGKDQSAAWPRDAAHGPLKADRFARVAGSEPEKKTGFLERVLGPRSKAAPGTEDEPGLLQRTLSRRMKPAEPDVAEPTRRLLTDPPEGYRAPSQDLNQVGDSSSKNKSWWNPLSYVGQREDDNDPVAQTAGKAGAQVHDNAVKSSLNPASLLKGFFGGAS